MSKTVSEKQAQRKAEERQAALEAAKPKAKAASASTTSEEIGFGFSNRLGLIPTEANTQTERRGQGFGFSNRSGLTPLKPALSFIRRRKEQRANYLTRTASRRPEVACFAEPPASYLPDNPAPHAPDRESSPKAPETPPGQSPCVALPPS